jgi:outer membrane protein assembly factor BamD
MKNKLKYLLIAVVMSSCKTSFDKAMLSTDKEYMLQTANENFQNKKWNNALSIYERLTNLVAGTDDAGNVVYNSATANYNIKNYRLAAHQYKNFSVMFDKDPRREEAAYMATLCYYEGSLDHNLDQQNTTDAINELQSYIQTFPNSEKVSLVNARIEELTYKLEKKDYENAVQLHQMAEYKACIVAFENVLNDFPSTKLKPQILEHILDAKYILSTNSIFSLKQERLENAIAYTKEIEQNHPDTKAAKLALSQRPKLEESLVEFNKLKADIDEKQAAYEAKIKKLEEEANASKK